MERDNQRLRELNTRLEADLDTARRVIEVQGKVSALLEDLSRRARRIRGANAVAVRAEFTTAVEQVTDAAVLAMAPLLGTVAACTAAGRARATHYRRHRRSPELKRPVPVEHVDRPQPSALSVLERADILAVLHSERFCDAAPAQVWATPLNEGIYLGSGPVLLESTEPPCSLRKRGRAGEVARWTLSAATARITIMYAT